MTADPCDQTGSSDARFVAASPTSDCDSRAYAGGSWIAHHLERCDSETLALLSIG